MMCGGDVLILDGLRGANIVLESHLIQGGVGGEETLHRGERAAD